MEQLKSNYFYYAPDDITNVIVINIIKKLIILKQFDIIMLLIDTKEVDGR